MPQQETAIIAKNMFGEDLYQQRARLALPILVRQALSHQKILYQDLGAELTMPNARNLNYVLGSVGVTLEEIGDQWGQKIPLIQCLVVNKDTGLPGKGVDEVLLPGQTTQGLTRKQRESIVNGALTQVFAYSKWSEVLKACGLAPVETASLSIVESARSYIGGGESPEHNQMKNAIAENPSLVGLPAILAPGETEFRLPSGDSIDVLFRKNDQWRAVEVKTALSDDADISRGLFQCVKYLAVLEAWRGFAGESADVRVMLALEGILPKSLIDLRNSLGVHVVESVNYQ